MADPSAGVLPYKVPSSSVEYSGAWVYNSTTGIDEINNPSVPAEVSAVFIGTRAGVFGEVDLNGGSLNVSIVDGSSGGPNWTQSVPLDPNRARPSLFFITDSRPCSEHTLTLKVNPGQSMRISNFSYEACFRLPPMIVPPNGTATPSSSALAGSTSRKSLRAGLIAGIVISSLLTFFILGGVALLFLRRRRRRQRRRSSRSRSWIHLPDFRGKQKRSPAAQYLASIGNEDADDSDHDGARCRCLPGLSIFSKSKPPSAGVMQTSPLATELPDPITSPLPPRPRLAQQRWLDAKVRKPPAASDGGWSAKPESEMSEPIVRGYLVESKDWMAREDQEQEGGSESSTTPTTGAVESLPPYKPRASFRSMMFPGRDHIGDGSWSGRG